MLGRGVLLNRIICGGAALMALAMFASEARGTVVDSFNNGDQSVSILGGSGLDLSSPSTVSGLVSGNPIGNARSIQLERLSGTGSASLSVGPSFGSAATLDTTFSGTAHDTATGILSYGNSADLNLNLSTDADFAFNFAALPANLPLFLVLDTDGGGSSIASVTVPKNTTAFELPFTDFAGTANFGDIDQVTVELTGSSDVIQLNQFSAVPEPGTALMLTLLAPAALFFRKA